MRKSFTVGGGEDLGFDLVGTDVDGNPVGPISFACLPKIQGKALSLSIAAFGTRSPESVGEVITFIEHALRDEELVRFRELIDNKRVIIDMGTLADICEFLLETYGEGLPTVPSDVSSVGQSSTTAISPESVTGAVPPPIQENYPFGNSAMPSTP